jgi:hypothetical protein
MFYGYQTTGFDESYVSVNSVMLLLWILPLSIHIREVEVKKAAELQISAAEKAFPNCNVHEPAFRVNTRRRFFVGSQYTCRHLEL